MVSNLRPLSDVEFSIRLQGNISDSELPQSRVYIGNSATGLSITGALLEAAVKYKDFYLAFLSNDIPNEDSLNIYLIDENLNIIDSAVLGSMYATGSFHALELLEPNWVKFNFFGGIDWCIELYDTKQKYIPFFTDPKGITRSTKLLCYFKINGSPKPECAT